MNPVKNPIVLVAPLDWGLGHTTRCIPIIRELIKQGCRVLIAGNAVQKALLLNEFPQAEFLDLFGYNINYSKSQWALPLKIFSQSTKILFAIKKEREWLQQIIKQYEPDAVISDNRYGLTHPGIYTVFITHQLFVQAPFFRKRMQKWNYKYIQQFSECWVPDWKSDDNFSGELSHPEKLPRIPVQYLGPLSRLTDLNLPEEKNHLLILLSGPEPQRTILENKIVQEIGQYPYTATVVRGLPIAKTIIPSTNMIQFYNHLPTEELNKEIARAEFVIARAGYTTIMDVLQLKKKSILVPTPGQTEQKYLAAYLLKKQWIFSVSQKKFSMHSALQQAKDFQYRLPPVQPGILSGVINQFLQKLEIQ